MISQPAIVNITVADGMRPLAMYEQLPLQKHCDSSEHTYTTHAYVYACMCCIHTQPACICMYICTCKLHVSTQLSPLRRCKPLTLHSFTFNTAVRERERERERL